MTRNLMVPKLRRMCDTPYRDVGARRRFKGDGWQLSLLTVRQYRSMWMNKVGKNYKHVRYSAQASNSGLWIQTRNVKHWAESLLEHRYIRNALVSTSSHYRITRFEIVKQSSNSYIIDLY
jgi:hypothetical protein